MMRASRLLNATALAACIAALAGCANPTSAPGGDDFPDSEMRLIVTFPAGGPTDLMGRAVAAQFEDHFGVPVVVENVDGASGAIGLAELARSTADGNTLAISTNYAASRAPETQDVGYELEDLRAVGVVSRAPVVLVVGANSPFGGFRDLIAAAEAAPETVTVGTAGAQTSSHVELMRMADDYGTAFRLVPFQGDAENIAALLGGNIDVFSGGLTEQIIAMVEDGQARILATWDPNGLPIFPDVPSVASEGYDDLVYGVPDIVLFAPSATPDSTVAKLETALEEAWATDEVRDVIGEHRMTADFIGSQAEDAALIQEREVMAPILNELD